MIFNWSYIIPEVNLLMILPVGFVSKKDIGLRITECNKLWWILVDALPIKMNKRNTKKKTPIPLINSSAE